MKSIFGGIKAVVGITFFAATLTLNAEITNNLPRAEILGKEYYVYTAGKGESLYGISKKYGWEWDELVRLNPEAQQNLTKGQKIYYPTGQVVVITELEVPEENESVGLDLEPIRHKVKKGETVYSISRQYGVAPEIIYENNPSSVYGVKIGEIVVIPQTEESPFYFYTVKDDDTLTSIVKAYNTTIEETLKNNPGLTVSNLKSGDEIRLTVNTGKKEIKVKKELVSEDVLASVSNYKVKQNETWEDISQNTGVDVDVLKDVNGKTLELKKNEMVVVPVIETIEREKEINEDLPEMLSMDDVQEIYDSIKGVGPDTLLFDNVRLAVILDDPVSKRDIDFTRGILVALSRLKKSPYQINLKVLDGRVSSNNIIDSLDVYRPDLIVSTAEKTFPAFLVDYGNTNNVQVVNVFNLKNDLCEDNPSMVQMLPPSSYFNDKISSQIFNDNRDRKFIYVGEEDKNDGISENLFQLYGDGVEKYSLEEFGNMIPDLMEPVVIYSSANKKEDITAFFKQLANVVNGYPALDYRVVGRPSWMAYYDSNKENFKLYSVHVPARVWLNESSSKWNKFKEEFSAMFGSSPVRSIPNYSAEGFDIASYFIPEVAQNKGDFNKGFSDSHEELLQTEISLSRINNWGGFLNNRSIILWFTPDGNVQKITVE